MAGRLVQDQDIVTLMNLFQCLLYFIFLGQTLQCLERPLQVRSVITWKDSREISLYNGHLFGRAVDDSFEGSYDVVRKLVSLCLRLDTFNGCCQQRQLSPHRTE